MGKRNGRRNGRGNGDLIGDMIKGAIGGAVGVWTMDRVGWDMYLSEDPEAFAQEKEAQVEGRWASHAAVDKVVDRMGVSLTDEQQHKIGKAAHYSLGIVPGAMYGALRNRVDGVGAGRGLLYGLGIWLVEDEGLNPLLGFTSGPMAYPWQAHWRGLVEHLVLGLVTDTVIEVLDQVT
jgi:hypothetical protein